MSSSVLGRHSQSKIQNRLISAPELERKFSRLRRGMSSITSSSMKPKKCPLVPIEARGFSVQRLMIYRVRSKCEEFVKTSNSMILLPRLLRITDHDLIWRSHTSFTSSVSKPALLRAVFLASLCPIASASTPSQGYLDSMPPTYPTRNALHPVSFEPGKVRF